ncbi:MAG: ribosome small subunit-dependent GTPase A [Magnetococcus sp. WYHC-3]
MELTALGFDDWVAQRSATLLQPGQCIARVTAVDRDAFLIRSQGAERYAELAGKLRFETQSAMDLPCVGDWVCVQWPASEGPALIHAVVPRKTLLRRKRPGTSVEFQIIASNIDVAFIVQACDYDFNLCRLDRYLTMAAEGHIAAQIVLSKTDLISPVELEQQVTQITDAGISAPIRLLSNTNGVGVDEVRALLSPGKTYCLLGSSGVGKTTLINRLIGNDAFATQTVSDSGQGVHTTTRRHLLVLDGGAMLVDTPGMRELGLIETSEGLKDTFAEVDELARGCRFSDCTHSAEPGCAILLAVANKTLSMKRYGNYIKLRKESEHHALSYFQKRKKDKEFGRFIKSAKKSMKE